MARSSEAERKSAVNRALRATRRLYRTADSQGESLERTLDRLILRKTRVLPQQLEPTINQFRAYKESVLRIEKGLSDLYTVASY